MEHPTQTGNTDPALALGPTPAELHEKVTGVIGFFNAEFGLDMDNQGTLNTEPSAAQLTALKGWHEGTTDGSIIMPDMDTFTAKMVLARALMPQVNADGQVQYLFGKGAGAELALQGNVAGRNKRQDTVPYRTHSDFEIYAAQTDSYTAIEHSDRFVAVFGSQEIYPATKTKGLADLPDNLLHETAETVDFGGVSFLVPQIELQFVDKHEKANERVERDLRGRTDAEWLATTYELDASVVHDTVDKYVIAPELAKLEPPENEARKTHDVLTRKVAEARRRLTGDGLDADTADVRGALGSDFILATAARNKGIEDVGQLLDASGELRDDADAILIDIAQARQAKITEALQAKHQAIDATLAQTA